MHVVIAGGHGAIARHLGRLLVARGDTVTGIVRNDGHVDDLGADGIEAVVLDLETDGVDHFVDAMRGADAVVFAAGAGPGSGAARKETVDYGGVVTTLAAARAAGVERYVVVSSLGTNAPPSGDEVFAVYLRAKARADRDVMDSDRAWTVVRPGALTDDPGSGRVELSRHVERADIPRADVATVVMAVLDDERTVGQVIEVVAGDTPIAEAVAALVG